MEPSASKIIAYALQVAIWRRLNRVTVQYDQGIRCTWHFPNLDDINRIAGQCCAEDWKMTGSRGCVERWTRP